MLPKRPLRVYLAQINTTVGDFQGNRRKILDSLKEAKKNKARLVVFPELTITGYPPEDILFREDFIADNLKILRSLLPHTRDLTAAVGFVDRKAKGALYNSVALLSDARFAGVYHKRELPNYGVFDEKRYFRPGGGALVVEWGDMRFGLTVCEDIWQKDSFIYQRPFAGTLSFLINVSASPYHKGKHREREILLKDLAVRTQAAVIYQNLVGGQDELVFDGGSLVLDPSGKILARAKSFEEDALLVDLSVKRWTKPFVFPGKGAFPFVINRRRLLFKDRAASPTRGAAKRLNPIPGKEEEVYKALVLGTKDYLHKNGFKKALVGLSGGIDSSLVACVAGDALGPENVIGVTMPSPYTSKGTYRDAKRLAANMGISCLELRIDKIYQAYLKTLEAVFGDLPFDQTEENLQARIRGNLLMALSNKRGYLVLTTGNKSEMATGYCTLYGDTAGGFAVIKDVPKTLVFALARYRNSIAPRQEPIPQTVLKRPPTAELRPNQKDQDTLPPYPLLDRFLEFYIEKDMSLPKIIRKGIPRSTAERTARMIDGNEYKRRQAPPGVKITPKAFGRDRRMPITNGYACR